MKYSLFILLFVTITSFSQKIVGVVFDKQTNKVLPGVSIHFLDKYNGVSTSDLGEFKIRVKKKDILIFSHIGYKTQEISIAVLKSNNYQVFLELEVQNLSTVSVSSKNSLRYKLRYTKLASLKKGVFSFGSLLDNNKIYLVGGDQSFIDESARRVLTNDKYADPNMSLVEIVNEAQNNFNWYNYDNGLYVYDLEDNNWMKSSIEFRKRAYNNLHKFDDKLLVIGGTRLSMNDEFEFLDDKIEVYDIKTEKLIIDDVNPHQAVNFTSVISDGNLIVLGGSIKEKRNGTKEYSNKIHLLDLKTGLWFKMANMPEPKETKGILLNDKIYLIGGFNGKSLSRIESLDLKTGKWAIEGELFGAIDRPGLAQSGDVIFIYDSGKLITFNIKTNELNEYLIELYLKYSELYYADGMLYLLGGYNEDNFNRIPSSNFYSINLNEIEKTRIYKSKNFQ